MARQAKLVLPARRSPRRVSLLTVTSFVLIVFAASLVAWLALTYDPALDPNRKTQDVVSNDAAGEAEGKPESEKPDGESAAGDAATDAAAQDAKQAVVSDTATSQTKDEAKPANQKPAASDAAAAAPPLGVLTPAPVDALVEKGEFGLLPIIADDGRTALKVYARPYQAGDRPLLSLVVRGLSRAATAAAIRQLPGAVTLAFLPYGEGLQEWSDQARRAGHETLIELPMEPDNYPSDDPGPMTLLATASERANDGRLDWLMSRFTGYVGAVNFMGSRLLGAERELRPVLLRLRRSGLMFMDTREVGGSAVLRVAAGIGLPRAYSDRTVDSVPNRRAIDGELEKLVALAKQVGHAVGIAQALPVTLERLDAFARRAERLGVDLAPLSALADVERDPA